MGKTELPGVPAQTEIQSAPNTGNRALTPQQAKANDMRALVKRYEGEFARALPKHIDAGRFTRVALTEFTRMPKLLECTIPSVIGGMLQAAQLGLEIGMLGHAYLIPYGNKAQLVIGYQGLIDLGYRSGKLASLMAREVYEKDTFNSDLSQDWPSHKPYPNKDRGEIVAVYAVATIKDAPRPTWELMFRHEIDEIRDRSRSKNNGPWVTDYAMMARKTVLRRLAKVLPKSVELATAVAIDELADMGYQDVEVLAPEDVETVED